MLPASGMLVAAAKLLQQSLTSREAANQPRNPSDMLIRAASGLSPLEPEAAERVQAKGRITDAFFSVNNLDPVAIRVKLMERVGKEFDISMDDFESQSSYGMALKMAFVELKRDGGIAAITALEKKLGLDELGISLGTLINAITEPGGENDKKLDAALKEKAGQSLKAADEDDALRNLEAISRKFQAF